MVTSTHNTTPPTTIIAAFFGFLANTVTSLVSIAVLAGSRDQLVDTLRQSSGASMTEEQLQSSATVGLAFAIGVAALIALVDLWLAFKLKAGRNWARIVLTVLTLLQLASILTTDGNTAIGYVSCAIAVIAVVLSFLPASNAYIAGVKRAG
ncbi:hypothetical protein [Umezawaea sp.]|uniref:hypothetical protein n=1 Tax=Umezawaea sp. TaxID=1955258 RepID=UPI002ED05674